ncbi:MAG: enoyl-CoA hydratase/isomerase family protein [Flavobacteriaceae bacterium]
MDGTITLTQNQAVATITVGHPAANALPLALLTKLSQTLKTVASDTKIHVVVLQTEGDGAFCAGANLADLARADTLEKATNFFMGFATLINTLRTLPQITLARVHGKCVGGGVGWVAACDYAVATEVAAVKLSELALGIGPHVIAPAVKRKIGTTAFSKLSLDCTEWHSAAWAHEKGLFAQITTDQAALDTAIERLSSRLAKYPISALTALKKLQWEGTEDWEIMLAEKAKTTAKLALSEFTQSIIKKLIDK